MKSTFFFYKNYTRLVFNASPLIAKSNAEKLKGLLNLFTCFFANHPRFQVMLVMRKIEVWKLIWYKESKLSDNLSLTVTIYKKIPLTTASSIRIFLSIEGKWVFSPLLIDPQLLNSFLWQTQNCQLNDWMNEICIFVSTCSVQKRTENRFSGKTKPCSLNAIVHLSSSVFTHWH